MKLFLVRHPRPVLDKSHCYGRSDIAIAEGELALCVAGLLAQLPRGLDIRSSPLRRCAELAQALAQALACPALLFDPGLQEMDFGSWERRAWDDIAWDEVEAWNRDLANHAPGGGESLASVARRVWKTFVELQGGGGDVIVIGHAGSIRMLRACAAWQLEHGISAIPDAAGYEAIALGAAAQQQAIGFGEFTVLDSGIAPGYMV